MSFSDTLTLIGMIVTGLVALLGQAIGLVVYGNKVINSLRNGFQHELTELKKAHDLSAELLHGRINNIRKEFVTGELYQRDLAEMKQVQREILSAIQGLGSAMQIKIAALDKTDGIQEYRLNAIDDILNGRNGRASTASVGG